MASPTKKRVYVSFVDDDEVVQHVIDGVKASRRKNKLAPFSSRCSSKKKDLEEMVEGSTDEEDEHICRASLALAVEEGGLSGGDVYQFRTPKKAGQMVEKASETRTPKSILKTKDDENTPQKSVSFIPSKVDANSLQNRPQRSSRKPEATTPYRLRKRHIIESDDSDDSNDSSDEDSDDSEVQENRTAPCAPNSTSSTPKSTPSTPKSTPSTPRSTSCTSKVPSSSAKSGKRQEELDMSNTLQDYFDLQSSGAGSTSDHTLAKLNIPRMDKETLNKMLSSVPERHIEECAALFREHRMLFRKWMLHMCHGFNILLYGLGSKRNLLEDFQRSYLKDFSRLVINGYFPSLTTKHILNGITEDILQHEGSFKSPLDQCEFIRKEFEKEQRDFYLIIHNIDGSMLRNEKAQNILSLLSLVPGIHILASVDHINSSLVWDQTKCSHFNWLWFNVTTFSSYTEETSYENSILVQQSGALALSSLTHVIKSLTPNARGIFLLLAKYQLENQDISTYIGMSFHDLYQRCREAFLVNSDLTLKAQLTEFRDHKLIRSKKSFDGGEHLLIPIDATTLTEFIDHSDDT
ncbi:hypothetical protein CHS0354_024275 [Potamilus streckersoni]|uniref:Origin recognition complex subunit 2 n=1 Tax=Potamilus streckersoni TaxID=2493646 RepID=A0AAE0SAQ4_9BIVA|nr:hypothetical protein CHS0354_024275 [Potamilus streckersoni]